jgi:hypothetical protein
MKFIFMGVRNEVRRDIQSQGWRNTDVNGQVSIGMVGEKKTLL